MVSPRSVARLQALGRIALGSALAVQPRFAAGAWVGGAADRPGAQVLSVANGTRDAAMGAGTVAALHRGDSVRPWLAAGIAADFADLVVTVRHRDHLPAPAVAGVGALATGSVLLGAWLYAQLD